MKRLIPFMLIAAIGLPGSQGEGIPAPLLADNLAPAAALHLAGNKHRCKIGMRYSPYFRRCVLWLPFFTA